MNAITQTTPPTAPARPTRPTETMRSSAAEKVVNELIKDGDLAPTQKEDATTQLAKMHWTDDGYEIAKRLDDQYYWNCSMNMIDTLDMFGWHVRKQIEDAQHQWVKDNNIQPPYPVGTRVKWSDSTGVITAISEYKMHAAKYLIAEDGDPAAHTETQRRIVVNFESVSAIEGETP